MKPSLKPVAAIIVSVSLLCGACSEELGLSSVKWACETTADCREGMLCGIDKVCIPVGPALDVVSGDDTGTTADMGPDVPPPAKGPWSEVAAGEEHTCAINMEGRIRCWGGDAEGEISDAPRSKGWHGIAAGNGFGCALAADGTPTCWGNDRWQQTVPPVGKTYSQISAGYYHVCGVELPNGAVSCWGYTYKAQTEGPGDSDGWVQVAAGLYYGCARKGIGTKNVTCWGQPYNGEDMPPGGLVYAVDLAVSVEQFGDLSLAISDGGSTYRWGLGGTAYDLDDVVEVSNGTLCKRHSTGVVDCLNLQSPPVDKLFAKLGPGWDHQCGILMDDTLYCWGDPSNTKTQVPIE